MKSRNRFRAALAKTTGLAAVAGLMCAAVALAEDFSAATLPNGVSIGFAVIKLGNDETRLSLDGKLVHAWSDSVNRLLLDAEQSTCFGYSLEIEPLRAIGKYRVTVKPLDNSVNRQLTKLRACASCPPPRLVPFSFPSFPPPLFVPPDVTVTLDLLQNPKTHERIVDVFRISPHAIPRETMAEASAQLVKAYDLKRQAQAQAEKKDYLGAVSFCRKSLELHPANAEVHSLLGVYYYRLHRLDKAKSSLQNAIDLRPDCYSSWTRMGVVHDTLGGYKQAIRCYKKALAIKPEFAVATWNLGTTHLALGQMDLGQAALEQAYRLDPQIMKSTQTHIRADFPRTVLAWRSFLLAKLCASDNRVDDALALLDSAIDYGFKDFDRVANDRHFQSVVQDERFRRLVSSAKNQRGS